VAAKKKPAKKPAAAAARARASALPEYTPQLATLVDAAPSGDDWLHEIKLDGYRIGCVIANGQVRLETRRGLDWTEQFAPIAQAAAKLPVHTALLDGEAAVLLENGVTSFQALQGKVAKRGELVYFAFDLLHLDGEDIAALALDARKARLQALLARAPRGLIKYTEHFVGDGPRVAAHACKLGTEGIVCKRRDARYRPGRNSDWLKVKCVQRQEFVVAGFTEPEGARSGIGALFVGYYDAHGALQFAGKVGTGKGFTHAYLIKLRRELDTLEQSACPFAKKPPVPRTPKAHWLAPVAVAEVQFAEWTSDGHLRHPSFLGFRRDKDARTIVRERPAQP
jgi:bifunctional non-homologous end joining protein LigD